MTGNVSGLGGIRDAYKVWIENPQMMASCRRLIDIFKNNIKMYLK
jgi:hypothetical protein